MWNLDYIKTITLKFQGRFFIFLSVIFKKIYILLKNRKLTGESFWAKTSSVYLWRLHCHSPHDLQLPINILLSSLNNLTLNTSILLPALINANVPIHGSRVFIETSFSLPSSSSDSDELRIFLLLYQILLRFSNETLISQRQVCVCVVKTLFSFIDTLLLPWISELSPC